MSDCIQASRPSDAKAAPTPDLLVAVLLSPRRSPLKCTRTQTLKVILRRPMAMKTGQLCLATARCVRGTKAAGFGHDASIIAHDPPGNALDALCHLGRGPARERHQQHAARVGAINDQMWYLVGEGCWSCPTPRR
jgi:hypothetical protein